MTKAEILADIESKIGDGFIIGNPELVETEENAAGTNNVKRYYINVLSTGADDDDNKNIGAKRTLEIYILNEGEAGEKAFYKDQSWINPDDQAWSGSDLKATYLVYYNSDLRERTTGAIIKAAYDIINEATSVANHAARVLLAGKVMQDDVTYLESFMFFIAINATVQSAGPGGATDNDIQYIINSNWDNVAKAVGLIS